jgi:hypothetical protein
MKLQTFTCFTAPLGYTAGALQQHAGGALLGAAAAAAAYEYACKATAPLQRQAKSNERVLEVYSYPERCLFAEESSSNPSSSLSGSCLPRLDILLSPCDEFKYL